MASSIQQLSCPILFAQSGATSTIALCWLVQFRLVTVPYIFTHHEVTHLNTEMFFPFQLRENKNLDHKMVGCRVVHHRSHLLHISCLTGKSSTPWMGRRSMWAKMPLTTLRCLRLPSLRHHLTELSLLLCRPLEFLDLVICLYVFGCCFVCCFVF